MKTGAIREAAHYRTKVAALEAATPGELVHVERDHLVVLKRQLLSMSTERAEKDSKTGELSDPLALTTTLLEQAEARTVGGSKRADLLEDSHENRLREHTDPQERHYIRSCPQRTCRPTP